MQLLKNYSHVSAIQLRYVCDVKHGVQWNSRLCFTSKYMSSYTNCIINLEHCKYLGKAGTMDIFGSCVVLSLFYYTLKQVSFKKEVVEPRLTVIAIIVSMKRTCS